MINVECNAGAEHDDQSADCGYQNALQVGASAPAAADTETVGEVGYKCCI